MRAQGEKTMVKYPKYRQQRIAWCTKCMNQTSDNWKHMIFSDESTFYVLERKNQREIWCLEKGKSYYWSTCNKRILEMVEELDLGEVFLVLERPMRRFIPET